MARYQAERRLILLSAGIASRRSSARDEVGRLAREVNWPRLAEMLRSRRLLPALGPRLLDLTGGQATGDFVGAVEDALRAGRRQGAFLQLVSTHLTAVLADAGIRSTPLKGPLLSDAIYGDPGRRPSADLDLLVAPEQLRDAVAVVRGMGYEAPGDYVQHDGFPMLHFALMHKRRELPPVELHWRIHWYERRFAQERLLPCAGDPPSTWRPSPPDEFAALLLFYARDGFAGLRLATDLSAWWDALGAELRPGALTELILAYPALEHVLKAAVTVAERVVGIPASQTISGMARPGLRERAAVRLANPDPRTSEPQQLHADMGLIDGLLTPPGGFGAFVRRQVLPPHEVLDARARLARDRRAISRLGYSMRVLVRYGLTIVRLIRTSNTIHFT